MPIDVIENDQLNAIEVFREAPPPTLEGEAEVIDEPAAPVADQPQLLNSTSPGEEAETPSPT